MLASAVIPVDFGTGLVLIGLSVLLCAVIALAMLASGGKPQVKMKRPPEVATQKEQEKEPENFLISHYEIKRVSQDQTTIKLRRIFVNHPTPDVLQPSHSDDHQSVGLDQDGVAHEMSWDSARQLLQVLTEDLRISFAMSYRVQENRVIAIHPDAFVLRLQEDSRHEFEVRIYLWETIALNREPVASWPMDEFFILLEKGTRFRFP